MMHATILEWYFVLLLLTSDGTITKRDVTFGTWIACEDARLVRVEEPVKAHEGRVISNCRPRKKAQ